MNISVHVRLCIITAQMIRVFGLYFRIKSLFFNLHDVMKTVGGAKIPCRILATTTVFIKS